MSNDEPRGYTAFWPVTIVLTAFAISFLIQIIQLINHRVAINHEYAQAAQSIPKAQEAQARLVALLNDVAKTAEKDPNAVQVMRLALQNGVIHQRPRSAADTNAAPANP